MRPSAIGGRRNPCRTATALVAPCALLALSACGGGIEQDIRQRFVEKYERDLCVSFSQPFPLQVHAGNLDGSAHWLQALTEAGLLTATAGPPARGLGAVLLGQSFTLDLTDAGRTAWSAEKGFCYGRTVVVEVIDYTKPTEAMGATVVQAEARLRHQVDAPWAEAPIVADFAKRGEETVSMVLVKKEKGGWSPAY
jgi:hypothetical protein